MGDLIPLSRPSRSSELASLGAWLFLGSWALTFVALLVAYAWVRARMAAWPPPGRPALPIALPTAASIVALFSSVSAQAALSGLAAARRSAAVRAVGLTLLLGAVFLVLQGWTWTELWADGLRLHRREEGEPWDTSVAYAGCFYALTSFHAAHVVTGLGLLGWVGVGLRRGAYSARERGPVRFVVGFWHLVSIAWGAVYGALFLVR
jgi:cytochrome c oxidase subunit 3